MKPHFITYLLSFAFAISANAQGNFIRRYIATDSAGSGYICNVDYFDGIGRKTESVNVGAAPGGGDVVFLSDLDAVGNPVKTFCGVAGGGGGAFIPRSEVRELAVNQYGDNCPFSEFVYDRSALNRVVSQTGQGQAWHSQNKAVNFSYFTNVNGDALLDCKRFSVADTRLLTDTVVTVVCKGAFDTGSLFVTRTEDEDGRILYEFKDFDDKVLLSRKVSGKVKLDTYYVYDDCGLLTAVIPPPAVSLFDKNASLTSASTELAKFAYFYIFDWEHNCRAKKLPGCEWQIMVYDNGNKCVMFQDGNLRAEGKAVFTLFDAFGRECVKGITLKSLTLNDCRIDVPVIVRRDLTADSLGGYSVVDNSLKVDCNDLLKVTYYDDYSFIEGKDFENDLSFQVADGYDSNFICNFAPGVSARGLKTGEAVRVLGYDDMLMNTVYYDRHGFVCQSHRQNYLSGCEHSFFLRTFTGKPLKVRRVHDNGRSVKTDVFCYEYDAMERLVRHSVITDGGEETILCRNSYDSLGRIEEQKFGGGNEDFVDHINFDYDIRGNVKSLTSKYFSQTLHYEDDAGTGAVPRFNGNICSAEWTAKEHIDNEVPVLQRYNYDYDGFDRLVSAEYKSFYDGDVNGNIAYKHKSDYSCFFGYNTGGNVTFIFRKGLSDVVTVGDKKTFWFGDFDDIFIDYDGFRMKNALNLCYNPTYEGATHFKADVDKEVTYTYDANGNLTSDLNLGIRKITYNFLNLPEMIYFEDRLRNSISYTYDADGNKLAVTYSLYKNNRRSLSQMKYMGNHVYKDGLLIRTLTDYGYFDRNNSHHYFIKDYRGDIRAVVDSEGNLEEINSYYPYGMLFGASAIADTQPYKYTGKEFERTRGLDLLDFGARFYSPAATKTTTMDPLCEKFYSVSPYTWCNGNPIKLIDKEGKEPTVAEAACIAAHVYGDMPDDILIGGWKVSNKLSELGIELIATDGLVSNFYERTLDDSTTEYVYATAGTTNTKDWENNAKQLIGLSGQYDASVENAQEISKNIGENVELNYVGHSKGGGQAALDAMVTKGTGKGRKAITFNAAGVSIITMVINWVNPFKSNENIDAYIILTDPLNFIQNSNKNLLPKVNGKVHYVKPKDFEAVINGHSINNFIE